jgi:cytoskeletal protein RodZ
MISQNELKTLGEILKTRRKEMNISLKEAENATSVRASYLNSIEEGEVSKLISPVYLQGFVKQYAIFLGLDNDKIAKDYPSIFSRLESQEFSYGIGTLEVRGNPGAGVKWFPNALWVLATVAVLVAGWYLSRFFDLI